MKKLINAIDDLLPQTQCGLCNYSGCRPYAEAIVNNNEKINRCLPGGIKTLRAMAELLGQDATSYLEEMQQKAQPNQLAIIREEECIGCTKCIQACPVDAILGANKQMHTVIADVCTGCGLCVAPCPVDCIDLFIIPAREDALQKQFSHQSRIRYQDRLSRLENAENTEVFAEENIEERQALIQAAVQRVKIKKNNPKK